MNTTPYKLACAFTMWIKPILVTHKWGPFGEIKYVIPARYNWKQVGAIAYHPQPGALKCNYCFLGRYYTVL